MIYQYFVIQVSQHFFPPVSGIIGGKFLERCRIKKPLQPLYSTRMSEYYLAPDLYVGAHVDFNSHKFILIDADEYAFRYMENNAAEVCMITLKYSLKGKVFNNTYLQKS